MRNLLMCSVFAAAVSLMALPAMAQTSAANSTSGASSLAGSSSSSVSQGAGSSDVNSTTSSGARSGSVASSGQSNVNVYNVVGGRGGWRGNGGGNNGSGGSTPLSGGGGATPASGSGATPATGTSSDPYTINTNVSGTQTLRNTPEVFAPSVVGGNVCAVGVSAGVSLPGFGIAGGASWESRNCERRQSAALLYNMGHGADNNPELRDRLIAASIEVLCQNDDNKAAFAHAGLSCGGAAAPVAAAQRPAAPVVAQAPAPVVKVAAAPPKPKASWCTAATLDPKHLATLTPGQRLYVDQNCGI